MGSVAHNGIPDKPRRVALYGRVSTEDQHEKQTIDGQFGFLHAWVNLYGVEVAGEYRDDGVSGAIPLGQRPDRRRLLDAHDDRKALHVTVGSTTEPIDTSTGVGELIFTLLASLAQLERQTMMERTTMGRDRVAKQGKWTGGPIPLGYDLDSDGWRRAGAFCPSVCG